MYFFPEEKKTQEKSQLYLDMTCILLISLLPPPNKIHILFTELQVHALIKLLPFCLLDQVYCQASPPLDPLHPPLNCDQHTVISSPSWLLRRSVPQEKTPFVTHS